MKAMMNSRLMCEGGYIPFFLTLFFRYVMVWIPALAEIPYL